MSQITEKLEEFSDDLIAFREKHDGITDELKGRIELLEASAGRPIFKQTDADEVVGKVFEAPELKAVAEKRSKEGGVTIPSSFLLDSKTILTDDVGSTGREDRIFGTPQRRRPWVYEGVTRLTTDSTTVEYVREASSSSATAGVQYGNDSPLTYDGAPKTAAALVFDLVDARTMTINIYTKVSRQALSDLSQLRAFLNNRLTYAVRTKLDAEVIGGDGTAGNFSGITKSGNFTAYSENSPTYGILDGVRDAMGQLENSNISPTLTVLNPNDLATIDISKASTSGDYLAANPRAMVDRNLWGVPVTTSSSVTAGDFVTGDFLAGAALWVREDAQMFIGTDGNDFTQNLLTVLVELRCAFGITSTKSFVGRVA